MSLTQQEFLERLREVAEYEQKPISATTGKALVAKRGRPSQSDIEERENEREFRDKYGDINPTLPITLTKIKVVATTCGDCDRICEQGSKHEIKRYLNPKPHWRKRCLTCNRFQNPETGKYDISPTTSSQFFNHYHNKNK